MNLRQILILLLIVPISIPLLAQDQLGLRLNNLSGINAMRLNPAAAAVSPYRWELTIAEASQFITNNYVYFRNANIIDVVQTDLNNEILLAHQMSDPELMPPGKLVMDFYDDGRRRFAYINSQVVGPSFYYKFDGINSIGLTTAVRVIGSAARVDDDISFHQFNRFRLEEEFEVSPFQLGLYGFSEIGLNYSLRAPAPNGTFNIGITAKWLRGYEGAFFTNVKDVTLARIEGNGIRGGNAQLKYGYTSPEHGMNADLETKGSGIGIDVGMYVTVDHFTGDHYAWKIGLAIVDIGEIRFNTDAIRHQARLQDAVDLFPEDYNDIRWYSDLADKAGTFSFQAFGDSLATAQESSFSMMLPSAVTLQVDRAFTANLFLGGIVQHYIPLDENGVRRGSYAALAPRYETQWLAVSVPVTMYNWQQLRVGAALRLGPLTIGTDHLGSLIGKPDELYGSDAYIAFSIFPFSRKDIRGRGGKELRCYEFD